VRPGPALQIVDRVGCTGKKVKDGRTGGPQKGEETGKFCENLELAQEKSASRYRAAAHNRPGDEGEKEEEKSYETTKTGKGEKTDWSKQLGSKGKEPWKGGVDRGKARPF